MSHIKMIELAEVVKSVLPISIKNFNEIRLPALESAWGRSFIEEMANEKHVTVEVGKSYVRPFNNELYRNIIAKVNNFQEYTTDGYDFTFCDIPVEHKNSFTIKCKGFTGSGFDKTPWHLLIKFDTDINGRINKCFCCIIDITEMENTWSERNTSSNFSSLKLINEDIKHAIIIMGNLVKSRKFANEVLEIVI